ncbi:putative bifunctional purine synthesis protein [Tribonema minus]|uniref:Putative bifunctional purine synthesis protein n=1 Tax=Tribonema minus TaxID=303371 RepID=A0A836CED7_9STRA|nr:putative bifunctional purine synthesis protein [Tribonema minus]
MAHILTAVGGDQADEVKITRALLSVSDKAGLIEFAKFLAQHGVELLSTGGTAKALRAANLDCTDVSDYTGHPEIMDGRVKTLHPKVHGGIMNVRGNAAHEKDKAEQGIKNIDLVVLNLYPFEATVAKGSDFDTCIENIDIGGPSMLRSSAKNHRYVVISTSPSQYPEIMAEMAAKAGATSLALRRRCAAAAYSLSAAYDSAISSWICGQVGKDAAPVTARIYKHEYPLKYGCNPHQSPAGIYSIVGTPGLPFATLNGTPGYINLMDAVNAWQLVKELGAATGLPAAASFKHCSPAGAAVAVPLSEEEKAVYECGDIAELTPAATAYLRARNADPMSSFGDFAALSEVVDEATAMVLKREVSDGIVAPGYEPAALAILKAKKGGKFIVLQADKAFNPPPVEFREAYGMAFQQARNVVVFGDSHLEQVKTKAALPDAAKRDLIVASIAVKYTQSNSVGYSKNGQMVGVGAGQQSRVDCVKLAGRKVEIWRLRHHPKVKALKFKAGVKRQDRVNARVRYIEGDITASERPRWEANFEEVPEPLTEADKSEFMASLDGVALASDAFFPFRDSIDHASKVGVSYIAQAGGSVADDSVIAAADEYKMAMAFTGLRLFHH